MAKIDESLIPQYIVSRFAWTLLSAHDLPRRSFIIICSFRKCGAMAFDLKASIELLSS